MDLHMDEDYGWRFTSGDWGRAGGNVQSVLFAGSALHALAARAAWLWEYMLAGQRLVDYGCAMGDGSAALAAALPQLSITGCDWSPAAVALAQQRWPTLTFLVDDIRTPTQDAHVIWTSHTLEHLADPAAAVEALRARCHLLVALFPPITTPQTTGPHVGAPSLASWSREVETPLFVTQFSTLRRDPECAGSLLEEPSLLCVWRGTHPSRAVRARLVPGVAEKA